ncbi:pilus assembly PilX family protein [Chromobacterium sphagni]|uniref:pilus assembly PilX family protein n=1 Tax=Chromobacterium sphagni TaxID=1903179 RepID=UPI0009F5AECC|nr:hypothetical protein [Chromobacterium sphagni]
MSAGRQAGGALLLVMSLLAALSMLVLSSSQLIISAQRLVDNVQDRRRARILAQQALLGAEEWVWRLDRRLDMASRAAKPADLYGEGSLFSPSCRGPQGKGLCEPQEPPERRRSGEVPLLHPCGNSREFALEPAPAQSWCPQQVRSGALSWANPRYVVELIDPGFRAPDGSPGRLYRITVRAWGRNAYSAVTLQSWYRVGEGSAEGRRLNWGESKE